MDRQIDPLDYVRSLSIRAALAGAAKAADRAAEALTPSAWIAGQTRAALMEVPGETLAQRFARLGDKVRELTGNNPAGLGARHEAGNQIAKALKAETAEHILTSEVLQKHADELDGNWDEAKQAAFDERVQVHLAATQALWGYDPLDVKRTLHLRDQEAVAREWNAEMPIGRESLVREYRLAKQLAFPTDRELRFADFVQAYQGDAALAQDVAWAKGLTDTDRALYAARTANLILANNNDLRSAKGIDGDRDAALRRQLGLIADTRVSDADLDRLREQEAGLQLKLLNNAITSGVILPRESGRG